MEVHPEHCLWHWGQNSSCCWRVGCAVCFVPMLDAACLQPLMGPMYSALLFSPPSHGSGKGQPVWAAGCKVCLELSKCRVKSPLHTASLPGRPWSCYFITWELLPPNNRELKKQNGLLSCCRGVISVCTQTCYRCKITWEWNSKSWMCKITW